MGFFRVFFAAIWVILEIDADRFNIFFLGGGCSLFLSTPANIRNIHPSFILFTINTEHCDL